MKTVYMDSAASTPVSDHVTEAMEPFFGKHYANPSAQYGEAQRSKEALFSARSAIAELLSCSPDEIYFTSSGSESNCTAVIGAARANAARGRHIVSSSIEHPSVIHALKFLESEGFSVTYVDPGKDGAVRFSDVAAATDAKTSLICLMYANNETGVLQPVKECAGFARERNVVFFTDAVQAVCGVRLSAHDFDIMSVSGHKINAPKGSGALYIRKGTAVSPLIPGPQERGMRGGTENVAFAVGLSAALSDAVSGLSDIGSVRRMRDSLLRGILEEIPGVRINGTAPSLPGILNVSFDGVSNEGLVHLLDLYGVAVSPGAACVSGAHTPSRTLKAMGLTDDAALSSVRFSLCRSNTDGDVSYVVSVLKKCVSQLRNV